MSIRKTLRTDETGVVAVEFAVLAVPFFLLLFAIMEIALVLLAAMQIEHATDRTSRWVMTGEIKREAGAIRSAVCGDISLPIDCGSLRIDYREVASVKDFVLPSLTAGRSVDAGAFAFATISNPSFASLRVAYEWPVVIKPLMAFFSNIDGGRIFLASTALVRIER